MEDFNVEQYRELISKIGNMSEKIVVNFESAIRGFETEFKGIPVINNEIIHLLEMIEDKFREVILKIQDYLRMTEVPIALSQAAESWQSIAGKAGEGAARLARLKQYQDEWSGKAGGKYQEAVQNQEPAMDQIQSRANQIASACNSLAQAGKIFYISIAVALSGLALAIATAGNPYGLAAGVATCVIALMAAVSSLLLGIQSQVHSFQMLSEPSDVFPGGAWPTSTAS